MTSLRTDDDPLLARLAALPAHAPLRELSAQIRTAALARLRPRPLHLGWALLVVGSAACYLVSALTFTFGLF
jgi:hypothetical protein